MGTTESRQERGSGTGAAEEFNPDKVFVAPNVDIPLDDSDPRYVKSFALGEKDAYTEFFKEFGFVIIRDVLTPEECQRSIDEIWTFLEDGGYRFSRWFDDLPQSEDEASGDNTSKKPKPSGIRRDDQSTWSDSWPSLSHAGILGALPVFTRQALANRQNQRVYEAFSSIMGREDLMVSHDRFGLFRPVCNAAGEEVNPEWKTRYSLHWDLNPWRFSLDDDDIQAAVASAKKDVANLTYEDPNDFFRENNEVGTAKDGNVGTQGLLNFADNLVDDGGFQLVVGFHKHLSKWAASTKSSLGRRMLHQDFTAVNNDDPLYKQPQRVSMRAGSLIIWDQRIAHGSAPNNSPNMRFCQFLKMSPAINRDSQQAEKRCSLIKRRVEAAGVEMTDIGKKLFLFEQW